MEGDSEEEVPDGIGEALTRRAHVDDGIVIKYIDII
jgi:hypothetical protein